LIDFSLNPRSFSPYNQNQEPPENHSPPVELIDFSLNPRSPSPYNQTKNLQKTIPPLKGNFLYIGKMIIL
jgi:hypothetical protein